MAEIVIIAELPVSTANEIDTTELTLLLRDVKAANIIDYVDSSAVEITPIGGGIQQQPAPYEAGGYEY